MNGTGKHRVVIVGGGFGGLQAAKTFRGAEVEVTLVDRRNFHLFQPLLYQVATGALSPANIAAPLRALLKNHRNTRVLMGEVTTFDVDQRRVLLADGTVLPYDSLIVAAGMRNFYFGHDEWAQYAPGLKTVEDATQMRRQVLSAFECAEKETDPEKVKAYLTFVVVGGGPTGVELAGALSEITRHTLKGNFRQIDPGSAQIILVEGLDRVLNIYTENLSEYARKTLEKMGVQVRLKTMVQAVDEDGVIVKTGDTTERIAAKTVLWGAGVRASELGVSLAGQTGAETDRAGRIIVRDDCTIPNHPEIFVVGDLAHFKNPDGELLPGVAQVAMQQGKYAAKVIRARVQGKPSPSRFTYRNYGNMATIGRAAAVADLRFIRLKGYIGWLAWLFIHLMQLVSFQNRLLVFFQWAWSYTTRNRAARLITDDKMGKAVIDALR